MPPEMQTRCLMHSGSPRGSQYSLMTDSMTRQNRPVLVYFLAILLFAWFCYQPAIGGPFQFDDEFNLSGLATIDDARSALQFIFSGTGGPTGRPLALASFALQADQWEHGAAAFLRVNILIHLVNAALLALCLYQLSLQSSVARSSAATVAAVTASLWVLMPLLASASLFVVQRMTTLSAAFMMLGLSGYLLARSRLDGGQRKAYAGMAASLIACTFLATLCKESGLLLPVFVLVLEATVLETPRGAASRDWRIWQSVFLVSPLLLLLAYLGYRIDYDDAMVASRGFDAWERLLTEARVLWVYLLKAVVGLPGRLGNYQDAPVVSRSLFSAGVLLACLAWIGLLAASIRWRRRYPLIAVAVLWYLAGHLIESTVVPLELYFEHRNYMPIIGPLFALTCLLFSRRDHLRRIATVVVLVWGVVNAWFLYSFATLSGQPSFSARYWAATYPESPRAVGRLARYQLLEEGPARAIDTVDNFVSAHPEHAYLRLPVLQMMCQFAPDQDQRQLVDSLHRELPNVDFTHSAAVMLFELYGRVTKANCNGVDVETVASLATTLRSNPRYINVPLYNQAYRKILAAVARQQGDYETVVEHLRLAIGYWPGEDLNHMMVDALLRSGNIDAARDFIDEAESLAPAHPVKALIWRRDLQQLRAVVDGLEQTNGEQNRSVSAQGFDSHD